jgi:glycine amidinotransferase
MTAPLPKINSHTNWGRLEEVWLGDCYPAHFYDNLESEVRDVFYEITEKTQEDLTVIQRRLEEFGVQVRRPCYDRIENFLELPDHPTSAGQLRKPMITPRDHFLAFGNTLYGSAWFHQAWADAIADYSQDPASHIVDPGNIPAAHHVCGANTVRAGRDLYLDTYFQEGTADAQYLQDTFKDYRLHLLNNGGHVDACFAVLKPGVLLTSQYFLDYNRTFPGWKCININRPEFLRHNLTWRKGPVNNGKWYLPGIAESAKFNAHVIAHAKDWVGDYTETYFEVNCLVIDEHNVFILGENDGVFRELERHGITAHSLPFRTRTFWDGGLHCLTLDIRRQDTRVDLFPDRTENFYTY